MRKINKSALRVIFDATADRIYLATMPTFEDFWPMYEPADMNSAKYVRFNDSKQTICIV